MALNRTFREVLLSRLIACLSRKFIKFNMQELRALAAALIGHGAYNKHLFNLGIRAALYAGRA